MNEHCFRDKHGTKFKIEKVTRTSRPPVRATFGGKHVSGGKVNNFPTTITSKLTQSFKFHVTRFLHSSAD
jgi:hypothetical protein